MVYNTTNEMLFLNNFRSAKEGTNINDKLKKDLDEDEYVKMKDEYIGLIEEHWKDDISYIEINKNKPIFTEDDKKQLEGRVNPFSDLDDLNRCGVAFACISNETISSSSDKRPKIHSKPTGFLESKKEDTVNGKLIFQRCHLIGYYLFKKRNDKGVENANLKKIFTGTRFMNNVMFYYEKKIHDYVCGTEKYVLYRVTPYFKNSDKLVYGVQMEAMFFNRMGKEDKKSSFNIFVYNKQPCIWINYETGKVSLEEMSNEEPKYVIDKKKKKYHIKGCASIWNFDQDRMSDPLKKSEVLKKGIYHPCEICCALGLKE